jgi:hypothetical protein
MPRSQGGKYTRDWRNIITAHGEQDILLASWAPRILRYFEEEALFALPRK